MKSEHNLQVEFAGHCDCLCHLDGWTKCWCGAPEFLQGVQRKSRKPRRVNLESRVKAFNRTGSKSAYSSHIIAVSKGHQVHQPRSLY